MNHLRELRKEQGLAQQGLAVRASVSPSLVVMIERWGYRPTEAVRDRIARALNCNVTDIWSNSNPDAS